MLLKNTLRFSQFKKTRKPMRKYVRNVDYVKDYEKAEYHAAQYLSYIHRGADFLKDECYDDAEKSFKIATTILPEKHEAYTYLAVVYNQKQDMDEYLKCMKKAIANARIDYKDNSTDIIELLYTLTDYYYYKKDFSMARKLLFELFLFNTEPDETLLNMKYEIEKALNVNSKIKYPVEKVYSRESDKLLVDLPVELKIVDELKGRGLFAKTNISKGDIIFTESPIVAIPSFRNKVKDFCYQSMSPLQNHRFQFPEDTKFTVEREEVENNILASLDISQPDVKQCEHCQMQFYSAEHESIARKTFLSTCQHGCDDDDISRLFPTVFEENYIKNVNDKRNIPLDFELRKLEFISKLAAIINQDYDVWNSIQQLLCWTQEYPLRGLLVHEEQFINFIKKKFPGISNVFTDTNFLKLQSIIEVNTISISPSNFIIHPALKEDNTEYNDFDVSVKPDQIVDATGLYLKSSLFNHSCVPNIEMLEQTSSEITWIASKDIEAGEELKYAYIDPQNCKDDSLRIGLLQHQYKFLCDCPICTSFMTTKNLD